jgi:hypothetical protein
MYDDALMPRLEGMVLASVRDHVQSSPDKPHVRQAFEGWRNVGGWVQINPSPSYVLQVDPTINPSWLPNNAPNTPPADWANAAAYCIAEAVPIRSISWPRSGRWPTGRNGNRSTCH